MKKVLYVMSILIVASMVLAACGGSNNAEGTTDTRPTPTKPEATPIQQEDRLIAVPPDGFVPEKTILTKLAIQGDMYLPQPNITETATHNSHQYIEGTLYLPEGYCLIAISSKSEYFVDMASCRNGANRFQGMNEEEINALCAPPEHWLSFGNIIEIYDGDNVLHALIKFLDDGSAILLSSQEDPRLLLQGTGLTISDLDGKEISFFVGCDRQFYIPPNQPMPNLQG